MFVLLRLIINAVALLVTAWVVPGIHLGAAGPHPTQHDWVTLLVVALIFGLLNTVIRPIVFLLSLPLAVLFIFVINAFMLLLTSWVAQGMGLGFRVDGFFPALFGSLLISVVSFVLSRALTRSRPER